jgi:urease accessory protein
MPELIFCLIAMSDQANSLLILLQLADSALPIGSAAHSYGLETLVFDGEVSVTHLEEHFRIYLEESGLIEAVYARRAFAVGAATGADSLLTTAPDLPAWLALNRELSARKLAREGREASAVLGRRLLRHVLSLEYDQRLRAALEAADGADIHHATAFGLIGGVWRLEEEQTVLAFLQQTLTGLVSACQRLMPLGQSRAQSIIWCLRPTVLEVVRRSATAQESHALPMFTPLPDVGGMRHPGLPVRLFIS